MNDALEGKTEEQIRSMAAIGIDLGTSTSAIAILDEEGKPYLVSDENGDFIVPSIVQAHEGELIVGSVAKAGALTFHDKTAIEVKRLMGTGETVKLGKRIMFPEEVSAQILKHLKGCAEMRLNRNVTDIVLTVPARFENAAREATKKAAELAGLNVLRLIHEPTAAALTYGLDHLKENQRVLVFDFGGGTLDVTVLEMFEGILDVKTSVGDDKLGGKDIDDTIIEIIRERYAKENGKKLPTASKDRKIAQMLKEEAERVKKLLSFEESVTINLPYLTETGGISFPFNREELDALLESLLMRAMSLTNEALARARLRWDEVDVVLPIGGSSRIPLFRRALEFASGKPLHEGVNPDEAVAMGAAIAAGIELNTYAEQQKQIMVLDVSPHRLGVAAIKQVGPSQYISDYFSELIPKDAKLPSLSRRQYRTLSDGGEAIVIQIYEAATGSNLCRDHRLISEMPLRSLSSSMKDEQVQVDFSYTMDGMLEVIARYVSAPMVNVEGKFMLEAPVEKDWRTMRLAEMCAPLLGQAERVLGEQPDAAQIVEDAAQSLKRAILTDDEDEVRRHLDLLTDALFEVI
ncbi:MAG: Hsp70 family protein [Armatimonas sp.]